MEEPVGVTGQWCWRRGLPFPFALQSPDGCRELLSAREAGERSSFSLSLNKPKWQLMKLE